MRSIGVLAATAAALIGAAAPAVAESMPGAEADILAINTFRNQQSERCLDDSFAYGPRPALCNGLDFQKWNVNSQGFGIREFKNVNTGRCIASDSFGGVFAGRCGVDQETSWRVKRWGDGTMEFKNLVWDGCLQDTVWLSAATCDASREQSWY